MIPFAKEAAIMRRDEQGERTQARYSSAFTLIEVVLAVAIAAGMLLVVLTFYQQVAALRGRLIEKTAGVSAIRLLMERLTSELGAVRRSDAFQLGLSGGSDNLQLLKLEFPRPGAWTSPATAAPFRLVSYSLQGGAGLVRSESPLWASTITVATNESAPATSLFPAVTNDLTLAATSALLVTSSRGGMSATPARGTGGASGSKSGNGASTARKTRGTAGASTPKAPSPAASAGASSSPTTRASSNAFPALDDTSEPIAITDTIGALDTTNRTNVVVASAARGGLAIGQAQFVRFRYWDGSTWLDDWSTPDLPIGVEVSLGLEPLPAEMTADEYPFELYRRVIYLPNHGPMRSAAASTEEGM
jgi:hypothetical protein